MGLWKHLQKFLGAGETGDELDHDEPLEEADAAGCEVTAPSCEITAIEREGQAHESEVSLREEIFETFAPKSTVMVIDPVDQLPIPADERPRNELATAHAFTIESVVCVEDERVYVELFTEELRQRDGWVEAVPHAKVHSPMIPEHAPAAIASNIGARSMFDEDGNRIERRTFEPDDVVERWGEKFVMSRRSWTPVRPVRERCAFYKRQNMANDDVPTPGEFGHHIFFRNCTMRRSVGGAYMTLRDEAMYACEYRQPPDPISAQKYLDGPDRQRLASKRHLKLVAPFNLG